jgi:hypothetical protein
MTIRLLLSLAILLVPLSVQAQDHKYVGARKCRSCHKKEEIGNQYGIWLESKHAKAFETLATEKAREWAAKEGIEDPQTADECLKCHATAHGVPDDRLSMKFDRTAGVQCESCHGAGKDYSKKKVMIDRDKAEAKGLVLPTEEVCVECHNEESPAWDSERYTTAGGEKVGFDFEQALEAIAHPVPEGYDPSAGSAD